MRAEATADEGLEVGLDFPLPSALAVGGGTALFLCGWCFSPRARIRSLSLTVEGEAQPLMLHGMPRSDVLRGLHPGLHPSEAAGPALRSYRSGFWGIARVASPNGHGDCEILLEAELEDGAERTAELARIPTRALPALDPAWEAPAGSPGPLVAVCMATFEPPMELFRRQLDSIRAQTHPNWVCLISDDCSSPERYAAMERAVAGDPRFVLSRSPERLRFYRNFERALSLAPPDADFVAMADQDDRWHPDKLETLLREIGDAQLAYSDTRLVATDGEVIADTYWTERRNNHADISSLLMANSVTGAASLCRRDLLDVALPFPPGQFTHFHDHWVALVALALGDIVFVDRPLYDYVQHDEAVLGHAAANRVTAFHERLSSLRALPQNPRERINRWRMRFFVDNCRLMQFGTILEMRCGRHMDPAKRDALRGFIQAERSPLAYRPPSSSSSRADRAAGDDGGGAGSPAGIRLASPARGEYARARPASQAAANRRSPPPSLLPKPGTREPATPAVGEVAAKVAPLELAVVDDGPQRVNILIPTIDLEHFFGGYIGKLNLAARLAERGNRVRIVTVDPVGALPASWPRRVEAYSGLDGLFERVEVVFGRESPGVEVSRSDRFVATTWWTAHIAGDAVQQLGGDRFLYLIQEYEPFTFPMGTYAALAAESYRLPHVALFSSEHLRDYFRRHQIGVYAHDPASGDDASASFQNAITAVDPPTESELARRETRSLLFYARPEPHASRNMFELGMLALDRAAAAGAFGPEWKLHGVGAVNAQRRMTLPSGAVLELIPREAQGTYGKLLREHDVGLALMYTPHPSLVPIEMASAGMLTVTNSFENKTAEAMTTISSNLITAEPSIDGVATALTEAARGVGDFHRRARGSDVQWSCDWQESFGDDLMRWVEDVLEPSASAG